MKSNNDRDDEDDNEGEDDDNHTGSDGSTIEVFYAHMKNEDKKHDNPERDDDRDRIMAPRETSQLTVNISLSSSVVQASSQEDNVHVGCPRKIRTGNYDIRNVKTLGVIATLITKIILIRKQNQIVHCKSTALRFPRLRHL